MFETKVFAGKPANESIMYNKTFSIENEGVFSTYFLFGKHHGDTDAEDDEDLLSDLVDDIFGADDPAKDKPHNRALAASNQKQFDTKQVHLLIKGQMAFSNSYGYLNADQYPLMQFSLIMFFIYLVATIFWIKLMRQHKDN